MATEDPDVLLIIDKLSGPFSKFELVDEILKMNKKMKIIYILKEPDDTNFIRYLREKGIRDYFDASDTDVEGELIPSILFEDTVKEEVKKIIEADKEIATASEEKTVKKVYVKKEVVTIASPGGGGVGKTTLAINIGLLAAIKNKKAKVIVVDFNDEKPDIALNLNFNETKGLEGILEDIKEENFNKESIYKNIEQYNSKHHNFFILTGLKSLIETSTYTISHYRYIIDALKDEFDLVIIDTGSFKAASTYSSIEKSTKIIWIVRETESTLKSLKEKLDFFENDLDIRIKDRSEIMLNMTVGYEELERDENIKEIFEQEPIAKIRYNPQIVFEAKNIVLLYYQKVLKVKHLRKKYKRLKRH
ncbi:AAA family ATPase [Caldisalinibacter kiritimatiensis]|uniref:AAA domain-containing protein n=1 Tax=Caldisalinibacter kiritimatiensis TaxID=1304284 RepID=R1CGI8_9FIRM|nr:AAA family ATPase [Caldisalinibacter kiritimatiensis]EOD01415.1 hypothetical protein L21TH_0462 [Caldisalinibacter kiritimatiensis]